MVTLALRATPQEYFNLQPRVEGIGESEDYGETVEVVSIAKWPLILVKDKDGRLKIYMIPQAQQDNPNLTLIIVGSIIIIGIVGVVAIAAMYRHH